MICTLQRLNSSTKIPEIVSQIYQIGEIVPIRNFEMKLSWFLGSKYNLHAGDSYNAAFCILNELTKIYICDRKFRLAFNQIVTDYNNDGNADIIKFFSDIKISEGIPNSFLGQLNNIRNLQIIEG